MSTPFFFGPKDRSLLGHLHLPKGQTDAPFGVVICNPFGFEEVSAHLSLRHLADDLAVSGIATLRFDYWGCGNSAGDDDSVQGLQTWIDSVLQAVLTLQVNAGVEKVVLIGLRLGALLATLAANEQPAVVGVVAIAPVVQGRRYLREMRALVQASTTLSPADLPEDGSLEVTGFPLSAGVVTELHEIDLVDFPLRHSPRVLIIERDDMPSNGKWLAALIAQGVAASSKELPGYAGMMEDPQRCVVPSEMWSNISSELNRWTALGFQGSLPVRQLVAAADSEYHGDGYSERCLAIPVCADGDLNQSDQSTNDTLFGVLTVPSDRPLSRVVVYLNSGAVHSMGPNRLWVRIARTWALRGVASLRVDISGIGDSPARLGNAEHVVYSLPALDEVRQIVDYARKSLGAREVHLLGLCSGAYHAFKSMARGVKVDSAIMVNPLTYFWEPGKPADDEIKDYEIITHSEKYSRQLFTAAPWKKLFSGQLDLHFLMRFLLRKLSSLPMRTWVMIAGVMRISIGDDLNRELLLAGKNGGVQKFIFASGEPGLILLRKYGALSVQKMQARSLLQIVTVADADHTFTRKSARDRLMVAMDSFMFYGPQNEQ